MWRPSENLESFNRALVQLEQELLAVLKQSKDLEDLIQSPWLAEIYRQVDDDPQQAFLMTRIKSGHAMTPRHGINVMLTLRAWMVTHHRLGSRLDEFSFAALLHDLGHWRPDTLVPVYEAFSHEQARLAREHPLLGRESSPVLTREMRLWISEHHEQPDGKGYPHRIRDPTLLSQALRIVDCLEGLTTSRRTRPPFRYGQAMGMLERWAGFKFEKGLFKSLKKFLGPYPIGSLIRLKTGEIAITLPPAQQGPLCLMLSNRDGDELENPVVQPFDQHDPLEERFRLFDFKIPHDWRNIRPDLLNLPRYYD